MPSYLCQLECLNGIKFSSPQIPLKLTFYSYFKQSFSGEYHEYQLIPLQSYNYFNKVTIKKTW